jgi:antitoxin PrlF
MAASTLTSKGQITIPAQVRQALGVDAGDRIEFVEVAKGQFAIVAATATVRNLKGLIDKPARPVSIEEMNAAIVRRGLGSQRSG